MSTAALAAKKQQAADYFTYHPDSQDVQIVGTSVSFPGLLDYGYKDASRDQAGNQNKSMMPHITCYYTYLDSITPRVTVLSVGGKTYRVSEKFSDTTTYQGELWLVSIS
jgi:hypothetical protein